MKLEWAGTRWGPPRVLCGEVKCSEPSQEFCVQERLVESVSRASFQKVQLHRAAQCFRRKNGLQLLFL